MNARRSFRGLPLVGAAFGGVVFGHWMSYLLALPSRPVRNQVLRATGHGYWPTAVKLAVVLAVVSLAAAAIRQFRVALAKDLPEFDGPLSIAVRLTGLQVVGFIALEATERAAVGAPASSLLSHHVMVLGVLVQIVVAASAALLLCLFARAAGALARALARASFPRPVRRLFLPPSLWVPQPAVADGPSVPRAPPSH
jgi:hypothetical protein